MSTQQGLRATIVATKPEPADTALAADTE